MMLYPRLNAIPGCKSNCIPSVRYMEPKKRHTAYVQTSRSIRSSYSYGLLIGVVLGARLGTEMESNEAVYNN